MKSMGALMALILIAAACGPAPSQNPGSTTVESSPMTTAIVTDVETSWDPAWELPSDVREELEDALGRAGVWILVPTTAPQTQTSGPLSAEIRLSHGEPVGGSVTDIVIRREDFSVYLSVQSRPVGEEPICQPRLDDLLYPAWSTEPIRDTTGCSLQDEDAVSYVGWTENGQNILAQFGPQISMIEVISWVDTWEPLGSA